MNKNYLIFFLISISIIHIAYSVPSINITYDNLPNATSINLTTYIDTPQVNRINFVNVGNFSVTNVSCYPIDMFWCNYSGMIHPGNAGVLEFTTLSRQPFDYQMFTLTSSYLYLTQFLTNQINYTIYINSNSSISVYNRPNLSVHTVDTVTWFNNDTSSHSVTVITGSPGFDITLLPGQTYTFQPSSIQVMEYYDRFSGRNAYLYITNSTLFLGTHDIQYDRPFKVNLRSEYRPSQLLAELYTTDFTVNYDDIVKGVVKVTNMMNEKAYNIRFNIPTEFSSDVAFLPSDKPNYPFNLSVNESAIVLFNLAPHFKKTAETGKTYNLTLNILGDNINQTSKVFTVSVRFFDIENNASQRCLDESYWVAKRKFCADFPTSTECLTAALERNITIIEYRDRSFGTNFTETEVHNAFAERPTCTAILERLANRFQDVELSGYNSSYSLKELSFYVNESNNKKYDELNAEIGRLEADNRFKSWFPYVVSGFFVMVCLLIYFVIAYYKRGKLGDI